MTHPSTLVNKMYVYCLPHRLITDRYHEVTSFDTKKVSKISESHRRVSSEIKGLSNTSSFAHSLQGRAREVSKT